MARPPSVDQQMPESLDIREFSGLHNTVTRERLAQGELEVAANIDLDDVGQPHRRRGYTLVDSGDYHSLYRANGQLFAVKDGDLCVVYPDYTTEVIQASVGAEPLAYVTIGSTTYFSSDAASSKISSDLTVTPWGETPSASTWLSPVVNPTETLPSVRGRLIGRPPRATALAYLNGRIYLAQEKTLWATELYLYDYVDKTRTFLQFEDDISMLASTGDGLFVGTARGVWFLSGPFGQMKREQVSLQGVIPGSLATVPAGYLKIQEAHPPQLDDQDVYLFLTTGGLVAAGEGGVVYNVTKNRMVFPTAASSAAMFRRQSGVNQYVGVLNSGGTPSSNAMIGDYVDVEIRRFQGA